jgi:MFS family permease
MSKDNKIKKSLRASFWDGAFASVMIGLSQDYITPYALALKANVRQVSLLSSLPNLCASLVQLKSADITEHLASRRRHILISVFLQAFTILPIILIPYFFKSAQPAVLIFLAMLFTGLGAVSLGPWASLMSDHIPHNKRGQYFGWRNRVLGFVVVVSSVFAGIVLHFFKYDGLFGFWIILTLAMTARFISWYFLTKMYEPKFRHSYDNHFSFPEFLKRGKESNYVRFVFFVSALNFCVNIAAPFFTVFMLRDLKFSYLIYTLVMVPVPITTLLLIERWGRLADRVGNIRVLKFTALFIASLPLLWIIYRHPIFLIFVQILGGFAWSGFNLCATNFIFDSVSAPKRIRCHSYFNVINGFGISVGAILGGYLATHLPKLFGYQLLFLFLISSSLRFLTILIFAPKIEEARTQVEAVTVSGILKSVILK